MNSDLLQQLATWSDQPQLSALIVILVMVLESSPVIGFFIPGIFVLLSLGSLCAGGHAPFLNILLYAALGGGDR